MPRISVVEQYDNKDLIQQIYRLKDLVETGTASNIAVTDNHDGTITVDVTMRDGSIQTFTLANDNIATIAAVQIGADVTVTVTFESGSAQSFTFNVASGKVDVLTTAGDYVYSHNGATQGEIPVANFIDTSSAQAITGAKTVPLETTGVFSNQIASSNKVKNELDNYAPMVRTTGNQTIAGTKIFTGQQVWQFNTRREGANLHDAIVDKVTDKSVTDGTTWYSGRIRFYDKNDVEIGRLYVRVNANGTSSLCTEVRNSDGTLKFVQLAVGDVI